MTCTTGQLTPPPPRDPTRDLIDAVTGLVASLNSGLQDLHRNRGVQVEIDLRWPGGVPQSGERNIANISRSHVAEDDARTQTGPQIRLVIWRQAARIEVCR